MLFKPKVYLRVELNCSEIFGALKQLRIIDLAPQIMDSGT